jgi:hypothetical protein
MLPPIVLLKGFVMSRRSLFGASLLAALLTSTAVRADLTAQQVWDNWKAMGTAAGQTLTTTSEVMSGDTLTVSGIAFSQDIPDGGSFSSQVAEMKFREMGDGRVEVTMSPDYTMTIATVSSDGKPTEVGFAITQTGMAMIAAGDPGTTTYDYTAESIAVATTTVTEAGVAVPFTFVLNGNAVTGTYTLKEQAPDVMDMATSAAFGDAAFTVSFSDPETQTEGSFQGTVSGLAMTTAGLFGEGVMKEELIDALRAGFRTDFGITYGPTTFAFNVTDPTGPTSGTGKNGGGSLGLTMDKTRIAYKGGAKGVELSVTSPQIPFPEARLAYAESVFEINVPIGAAPETQDFTFVTKLLGLTVSDEIWSMIDPGATISRDPATLVIDTKAKAKLNVDVMDEAAVAAAPGGIPGELQSLDITALQLTFGGADFTGDGALTFSNWEAAAAGGMPTIDGAINLMLVGGNTLLDNLIALGLVPEDQAMGARMMMGMFARPGDGPDTLVSTIEFKNGGIFANGMQLQ